MKLPSMPVIIFFLTVLVLAGLLLAWYLFFFPHMNPPLPQNTLTVGQNVFKVEVASTMMQQTLGLSGRPKLAERTGMFFIFNSRGVQNFWMKDMNFPIDIIWIANNKVAGFAENAQPQPGVSLAGLKIFTSPDGVDKVLEVNAGTVKKDGIKVGDAVTME